ncbi:MAG: TonB-dependent receptor domain-containing protein [Erythrobacter sp.]
MITSPRAHHVNLTRAHAAILAAAIFAAPVFAQDTPSEPAPQADPVRVRNEDAPPLTLAGSRAQENAVRQASDAFGTIVGREAVGLYDAELVRGFSPLRAGNVRLDGLYFDSVIEPTDRTSGAINILVGPSALAAAFPAPSGLVDFQFRTPGREFAGSALVSATNWGELRGELDLTLPVNQRLSLGLGATAEWLREGDGRRDDKFELSLNTSWRPSEALHLRPFISLAYTPFDDVTAIYVPAGDTLPPRLPRRTRINPDWSFRDDLEINAGLLADWAIAPGWEFRLGIFNSSTDNWNDGEFLFEDVTPDGLGRGVALRDPGLFFTSLSGEAQLSRTIADGPRTHRVTFNLRGRDALRRFDGSAEVDLGIRSIFAPIRDPAPQTLDFGTQQRDVVRQWFSGLAYLGRWEGVGELSVGVQYTDFRKRIGFVDAAPNAIDVARVLYNVNAAFQITPRLALYGGHITGLEESGIAPGNAANRNEALPAIPTSQFDLGLRWKLTDDLTLIGGVFELTSPYFSLDAADIFRELGMLRNRGIEMSLSGMITKELAVNLGVLLLDPAVRGPAVDEGLVGPRAVFGIARQVTASLDWRPPFLEGFSFDLNVWHRSPETASVSNQVAIPTRNLIDLGARHFFKLGGRDAVLRVQVENLLDKQSFELIDAGAFRPLWPRRVLAYLTIDF